MIKGKAKWTMMYVITRRKARKEIKQLALVVERQGTCVADFRVQFPSTLRLKMENKKNM